MSPVLRKGCATLWVAGMRARRWRDRFYNLIAAALAATFLNLIAGIAHATPVAFESLLAGNESAIEHTGIFLVRDDEAWRALWAAHMSGHDPPDSQPRVDFARHTVIAFFAGRRGTQDHRVRIRKLERVGATLHLVVVETYLDGPDCIVLPATSEPFDMVVISSDMYGREVDFELILEPQRCDP